MLGVISFDDAGPAHKRRKAMRACQRCKALKKRCTAAVSSHCCDRCGQDGKACSFDREPRPAPSPGNIPLGARESIAQQPFQQPFRDLSVLSPLTDRASTTWSGRAAEFDAAEAGDDSVATAIAASDGAGSGLAVPPSSETPKEMRFVTMLHLLQGRSSTSAAPGDNTDRSVTKLISGTNPLSSLLRQDLKEKIVANSCSFRTPDPAVGEPRRISRRGMGVHNCHWKEQYQALGISEPRMQYLVAIGCFDLPSPDRCSHLLEIYFSHVHPILPVLDRKDFLARYYGLDDPPPLTVLHAVFLAASRYAGSQRQHNPNPHQSVSDAPPETRSYCDSLHSKLRALIETDICSDRVAIVQATLLASLHWEGREGLNSAIDNLGLAVRACQEMGLHRKANIDGIRRPSGNRALLRRLWWSVFALDRFNAAQEGTPFLINEIDCDADMLSEQDFEDEDQLTCQVTMLNLALARLIEDAVRSLYAAGEGGNTLFPTRGVLTRQRLTLQLEELAHLITSTLRPGQDSEMPSQQDPSLDIRRLWCTILLTHLDAVRILVHRPFITYAEPNSPGTYLSRDSCRMHAVDIVSRLSTLQSWDALRFSWPFTVYAVVNSLLIFWYDLSSPGRADRSSQAKTRQNYATVVRLLGQMGSTWWAAAAKHKLAEALAKAASELQTRDPRPISAPNGGAGSRASPGATHVAGDTATDGSNAAAVPASGTPRSFRQPEPPTPQSSNANNPLDLDPPWYDDNLLFGGDGADFWASIGLDFDTDVAENVFSIFTSGPDVLAEEQAPHKEPSTDKIGDGMATFENHYPSSRADGPLPPAHVSPPN